MVQWLSAMRGLCGREQNKQDDGMATRPPELASEEDGDFIERFGGGLGGMGIVVAY